MQTPDMTNSAKSNRKIRCLYAALTLVLALMTGLADASLYWEQYESAGRKRTIAVDPGHGGYDTGGIGAGGSCEKEITLRVAQALAEELQADYHVVLTRNGDYQVALTQRASIANSKASDLFISIHAGGSCRHAMDGWSIFFFKEPEQKGIELRADRTQGTPQVGSPVQWDIVCSRHQKESRTLAGCIKNQLSGHPDIQEVAIDGAVLRGLEGLGMPAIIIETGYLTNPETEKQLNDPTFLTDIARRIKQGIDIYLTR